jgi:hypothetical protein
VIVKKSWIAPSLPTIHDKLIAMDRDVDVEVKTGEVGREIHAAMSGTPPVFDTTRWLGNIMDWAIKNEDFKLRLFRFIDVLPSLKTDKLIVRLLHEYFSGETEIPRIISSGIGMLSKTGLIPRLAGPLIRKSVESIARQFIAGKDAEDAMEALDDLRRDRTDFSIDLLGEVVVSEKEARTYAGRHHSFSMCLQGSPGARSDVSIKVSSLFQLDPIDGQVRSKRLRRPASAFPKGEDLGSRLPLTWNTTIIKGSSLRSLKASSRKRNSGNSRPWALRFKRI